MEDVAKRKVLGRVDDPGVVGELDVVCYLPDSLATLALGCHYRRCGFCRRRCCRCCRRRRCCRRKPGEWEKLRNRKNLRATYSNPSPGTWYSTKLDLTSVSSVHCNVIVDPILYTTFLLKSLFSCRRGGGLMKAIGVAAST